MYLDELTYDNFCVITINYAVNVASHMFYPCILQICAYKLKALNVHRI